MHYAKIQTFQKHFRSGFVSVTCVYDLRNLQVLWITNNLPSYCNSISLGIFFPYQKCPGEIFYRVPCLHYQYRD